jgi:hypothetical protein
MTLGSDIALLAVIAGILLFLRGYENQRQARLEKRIAPIVAEIEKEERKIQRERDRKL